jgi:flagellin
MTTINTNTSALLTQLAMTRNERTRSSVMEQLSTGNRINHASDDAAGMAVSVKMKGIITGLGQVARNANDAISMSETADSALGEMGDILQRMRELSVQSATESTTNRDLIDVEFQSLKTEINRIAAMTDLSDISLLDGSTPEGFVFQVGTRAGQTINIKVPNFTTGTGGEMAGIQGLSTLSLTDANDAIGAIDEALDRVIVTRADLGATISRLGTTVNNLLNQQQNTESARSRVMDANYAWASTELARTQIIQEAATSILAQANMTQQQVLKLLQ